VAASPAAAGSTPGDDPAAHGTSPSSQVGDEVGGQSEGWVPRLRRDTFRIC
jgi:hypothetical protein